jgi:hypothetical protein
MDKRELAVMDLLRVLYIETLTYSHQRGGCCSDMYTQSLQYVPCVWVVT